MTSEVLQDTTLDFIEVDELDAEKVRGGGQIHIKDGKVVVAKAEPSVLLKKERAEQIKRELEEGASTKETLKKILDILI